ncbi:thiamine phosphate synthase [Vibrio profundi]|uniref:thiamine phosphate synthase n=1 Tax=Vibrio profundi TaxID=1774960 RepID=UPI0037361B4D
MKILIPAHSIELTGEVQRCLLIAEHQGFDIKSIELGVSPTHYFSLIADRQSLDIADCQYLEESENASIELFLDYSGNGTTSQLATQLQANPNLVAIGVEEAHSQFDIWSHLGVNRALSIDPLLKGDFSKEKHLAWLLTCLALDFPIEDSLVLARAACSVSRETWPNDFRQFPTPVLEHKRLGIQVGWTVEGQELASPVLKKSSLGLYPVVDSADWIEKLLRLGIKTTQLRIKDPHREDLEQQVIRAIELGREYNAQVYINDYWQLAVKHGAFGVHLGQEDIEESNLSALSHANVRLGLSTHGYYELLRIVQVKPSYIALGHIFPTTTKEMPSRPQGLVRLALYQKLIDTIPYSGSEVGFPTVAIGGIDQETAPLVWKCGVSSLAVVRAITLSESPQTVIKEFGQIMSARVIELPVKECTHA